MGYKPLEVIQSTIQSYLKYHQKRNGPLKNWLIYFFTNPKENHTNKPTAILRAIIWIQNYASVCNF
jgi:hypothetical protein